MFWCLLGAQPTSHYCQPIAYSRQWQVSSRQIVNLRSRFGPLCSHSRGYFLRQAFRGFRPFAAKSKTGLVSPQQSLAVLVQFRDLSISKSRNRTFVGENQLLKLAGNNAAAACDLPAPKRMDGCPRCHGCNKACTTAINPDCASPSGQGDLGPTTHVHPQRAQLVELGNRRFVGIAVDDLQVSPFAGFQ